MPLFEKLRVLADRLQSIPKVLQELTAAIRDAAAANRGNNETANRISAEIRFPAAVELEQRTYQEKQLRVQRIIALWTGLGFAAAAIYAAISYRQLQALKEQTTYAERAWVNANIVISSPLENKEDGAHFSIAIQGQNLGRAPASDVQMYSFVTSMTSPGYMSGQWEGHKYLDRIKQLHCPFQRTLGRTLLRDEPYRETGDLLVKKDDFTKAEGGAFFYPIIRYVVHYCIGFDDKVHTTVYDLMLRRNPDETTKKADAARNRSPMAFWADDGTVPADQIEVYLSPMGGGSSAD
jgi:DNA-binding transcriptional MerR regulator